MQCSHKETDCKIHEFCAYAVFVCSVLTVRHVLSTHSVVACVVAAAKQNQSTKDTTKKMMEEQLQTWFANARDRGSGGRKPKRQAENQRQPSINYDSDN